MFSLHSPAAFLLWPRPNEEGKEVKSEALGNRRRVGPICLQHECAKEEIA